MEERKRRIWNLICILVLIAVMTGFMYYITMYKKEEPRGQGTLVCITETINATEALDGER